MNTTKNTSKSSAINSLKTRATLTCSLMSLVAALGSGCVAETAIDPVIDDEQEVDPVDDNDRTVTLTWRVDGDLPEGGRGPIAGAEVCLLELGSPVCGTTDAQGELTIENVPIGEPYGVRTSLDGYLSDMFFAYTPYQDADGFSTLVLDTVAEDVADTVGLTWPDPGNGVIAIRAMDMLGRPIPGIAPVLSPSSDAQFFFFDENGRVDPALEETTEQGGGFVGGLPPGDYEVTFPGCEAVLLGWQGDASNIGRTVVEPHTITRIDVLCPMP